MCKDRELPCIIILERYSECLDKTILLQMLSSKYDVLIIRDYNSETLCSGDISVSVDLYNNIIVEKYTVTSDGWEWEVLMETEQKNFDIRVLEESLEKTYETLYI